MKKILLIIALCLVSIGVNAQDNKIEVYCQVLCVQYHLIKGDVNVHVDFELPVSGGHLISWQ